jgi:CubicO group peptidase (beta-lactamase class C family)
MTPKLSIVVGILAMAGGAVVTPATAQTPVQAPSRSSTDLASKVDAILAPARTPGSPGCMVSVIRDGKTLYAKGQGLADLERNVPITTDSVFDIGSTSKQFTAASIALLVLDGKLSLSTDVRTLIPELKDIGAAVTVEQLLHHTSGVREYNALLRLQGWKDPDRLTNEMILALLARQRSLNFTPGSQFLYSNSNYVLLAEIVKRVSGKPLPQFAKERLFDPLGMKNTQFESDASRIVPNRALSYGQSGGSYLQFHKTIEAYGAGNLLTTVGDLALWDENFYTGKVGGKPLLDMLQLKGVLNDGKPTGYGLGLIYEKYRGLPIVQHNGRHQGYRAQLLRFPEQHFSVIGLCNLAEFDPEGLVSRVADIYLANELAPRPAQVATTPVEAKIEEFVPSSVDMQQYLGRYYSDELGVTLEIALKGSVLEGRVKGVPPLILQPNRRDFFKNSSETVTFRRNAQGQIDSLSVGAARVQNMLFVKQP